MTPTIAVAGLTRRYHNELAVDDVSFEVQGPSITGLLGRNGAGKTTLLRLLAGQELLSSGRLQVLGASPVENDDVLSRMVLVREDQVFPDMKVRHVLRVASWCYPRWSAELADTLLRDFDLPLGRRVKALSTHLINEVAGLLERVLVIERGRIVLDASTDELHGAVTAVSGPARAVEQFVAGRRVSDHRQLASQASALLVGALDDADRARARSLQLRLEPLSLQEVVIHAADRPAPTTNPQERSTS